MDLLCPAFQENNVPVVAISSNYYAPYIGVFIQSLINHASADHNYDIIVMEHEVSKENKRILCSLAGGKDNISIRFCNPAGLLPQLPANDRYPMEVCCRVFVPYLFSQYAKIITVGADMLLKRDIAELLTVDLGDSYIGATLDFPMSCYCIENRWFVKEHSMNIREYVKDYLGVENPSKYVNPELAVYDCEKFRSAISFEKMVSFVCSKSFLLFDQDILNELLYGKIKFLEPEWNIMLPLTQHSIQALLITPQASRQHYERAMENPAIFHWNGWPKPWVCPDVPYGNEWWEVAQQTPFMGHIISRMFYQLQKRQNHYLEKYGQEAEVWDPTPKIDRSKKRA